MADELDDFLAPLRLDIESRIRDQLARHQRVTPDIDHRRIIDIQISQEKERLDEVANRYDERGEGKQAELVRALVDEWLPRLAHSLKGH